MISNVVGQIAVVGGAGHVGLPLSLLLAQRGFGVVIVDTDAAKVEGLQRGVPPFWERGASELLQEVSRRALSFCTEHQHVSSCDAVIMTVDTPVDEYLNPKMSPVFAAIEQIKPHLRDGQVLILRSTLFPGTSEKIHGLLRASGLDVGVSFCPERIAQGKALDELPVIPQIISGTDERALSVARAIFSALTPTVVELGLAEAELAKLFSNAWRYIKFAVSNQFYMIAADKGLDFDRIRNAMMLNYDRAADFPTAGFAAGPCLFKDTMQLAAYNRQNFALGHAAMLINETLPDFLVDQVKRDRSLAGLQVGILGMAFKGNSDDPRASLAYKLRKLLQFEGAVVQCTDPYVNDASLVPLDQVLETCEVIFLGCPHTVYHDVRFRGQRVVDCWGFFKRD